MQTVLISGGTGLIGRHLSAMLVKKGYEVIILTRDTARHKPGNNISYVGWDVNQEQIDVAAIQRADYIIHLAGEGVVDKKWTEARKQEIVDSRTKSSQLIVKALRDNENHVKAVISSSAIGWYGADTAESKKQGFVEAAPPSPEYLGETCRLWEESIEPVTALGKRLVKLRTGIVLSNDGGVFVEFKKTLPLGIASIMGSGEQIVSWIHIEDICRMYCYALENEQLHGVYNAVAPTPVTNKQLMLSIATAIKGKAFIPIHVPVFVLRLMLGGRSIEVLKSTTVSAAKIKQAGFQFLYPSIDAALTELGKK